MLSHNVFFTLADPTEQKRDKLIAACKEHLSGHPGTVFFACGKLEPELARPVNDRDFHVALHVVFTDRASHDAYQEDTRHHRFIEENKDGWASVRVFDSIVS